MFVEQKKCLHSDSVPKCVGTAGKEQTGNEIKHSRNGVVVRTAAVHRLEGLADDLVADDGQFGYVAATAIAGIASIEQ